MRKFLSFRTAQNFRSEDTQISFRKKIFFLPQGNKFSCGRKFSSVRTEILRRAEGEKSTFEGGQIFLRKKIFFRAHGIFAPSAEVGLALLGDGGFPPRKRRKGPD
nr:hypothetical protein [uncultured Porphyromonas sp.]